MKTLAFTLTCRPKLFRHTIDAQYQFVKDEIQLISKLHNLKFSLYTELTKSCNIHAHGIVKGNRPIRGTFKQYVHNAFRTTVSIGFIYLKDIDDIEKWYEYTIKDRVETLKDLTTRPIVMIDDCQFYSDIKLYLNHKIKILGKETNMIDLSDIV